MVNNDPAVGQDSAGDATSNLEQPTAKIKRHQRLKLSQISTSLDQADQTVDEFEEIVRKFFKLCFKVLGVLAVLGPLAYMLVRHGKEILWQAISVFAN